MSLENLFRNLNDIRVFDAMSSFNTEGEAINIHDILDILDYPYRESIQIEDSVEHLVREHILTEILVPEETTTGCDICKITDSQGLPRLIEHENHVPQVTDIVKVPKYYMSPNELTLHLITAVMQSSLNFAEN